MIQFRKVVIEISQKKSSKGDKAVKQILSSGEEPWITAITMHKCCYDYTNTKPLREFLQFPALDYTKKDAVLSSKLELEAEKNGRPALRTDATVAAIAINNRYAFTPLT